MWMTTRVFAVAVLVLLLGSLAGPEVAADEDKASATALLKQIAAAHKHPEHAGLIEALERVPEVHNALQNGGLRKKLQAAVGKVLGDGAAGGARSSAAQVLGRLNDPAGSYKQLGKVLPKPKKQEATPAQLEALRATASLAPEKAIAPLLKLAQKGKSLPAAKEAILALGSYGQSKKRVAILKDLLDLTSRHFAAAEATAKNPKGGTGDRPWKALGASLIETLNKLTGRSHQSAREWLDAYKEHKKKLAGLFPQ